MLLITPTFLVVQEKKNSEQLVSKNDNKPICGVIVATYGLKKFGLELSYHRLPAKIHRLNPDATLELKYYN
ncbi:MAG TPA: hypothetical protein VIU35_11450 [Chitinophagaceae bacterium]